MPSSTRTSTTLTRFYPQGEVISGTSYYYSRDHLGSVREMTDTAGARLTRYAYDSYGRVSATGPLAHRSDVVAGTHQHFFMGATTPMTVGTGDKLVTYIYLDPAHMPSEVMLQWLDTSSWEHRAYWGTQLLPWGINGTTSLHSMGALPPAGKWVRLEVPASQVGLEGASVVGLAFSLYDGSATWDHSGKVTSGGSETIFMDDALPAGATPSVLSDSWTWVNTGLQSDFQYAGYYAHQPSGLNLTRYRAYDPNTARWLARDPAGEGWDSTLYSYTYNNPVGLSDPLGLWGAGVAVAGSAEIGTADGSGAGFNGSAGYGGFDGGPAGFNTGGFAGGGAFAGGGLVPTPTITVPSQHTSGANQSPFATGAYAGFGGGVFLTNANSACELKGGFHQFNLNVGLGPVQFSLSVAYSGSTWIATVTAGPGFGASASGYPTYSATTPAPTPAPSPAPMAPLPRM